MECKTVFNTGLGEIELGDGLPAHLIAEIGLNHNGSMQLAREMIYQAALQGATFVKFQKRAPETLATADFLDAPFPKCPAFGRTQRQVRERLELKMDEYKELRLYAESLGMVFCCTAFDLPSLEFLLEIGTPVLKVASHSVTNGPLLKEMAATGLPIICSLGGAGEKEWDQVAGIFADNPLVLLHCVSAYPCPDHLALLDTIPYLKERYQRPVGFSSHEEGIDVSAAAAVMGACLIERHFTLHRSMLGLDQGISLEPEEFGALARRVRRMSKCRGVKTGFLPDEQAARSNYHSGVYLGQSRAAGELLRADDLLIRQPLHDPDRYFTGLEADQLVGKKLKETVSAGAQLARTMVIP